MVCFERAETSKWCHRALAAAWLAEALGQGVPGVGYGRLAQDLHPLLPDAP